jgi:hypothetical protein
MKGGDPGYNRYTIARLKNAFKSSKPSKQETLCTDEEEDI